MKRILALHGLRMSGSMLRELMHDVIACTSDQDWEWTFLDAPNEATGPVRRITRGRWPQGPYREWWNATEQPDGSLKYLGLEQTLDFMQDILSRGEPYELLAGYSQGSALLSVLTALAERADFVPEERRWRAALLFNSGTPPRDPALVPLFSPGPLQTPSIHILGGPNDVLYESQKAMLAHWTSDSRTALQHNEGHLPPSRASSPRTLAELRQALAALGTRSGQQSP